MAEVFETIMVVTFGLSWPAAIIRSIKSRSANGKSLLFIVLIAIGYMCGIVSKVLSGNMSYVLFFYILNLCMVITDMILFFRNRKLDVLRVQGESV